MNDISTGQKPENQSNNENGDNVAGNKQHNEFNAPTGIGGVQGDVTVKDNATVSGALYHAYYPRLEEIAEKLTELCQYFEENNYNPPLADAMEFVNNAKDICPELKNEKMIEVAIATNPTLKERLMASGSSAFQEMIKVLLPPVGIAIEAIKAYNNPNYKKRHFPDFLKFKGRTVEEQIRLNQPAMRWLERRFAKKVSDEEAKIHHDNWERFKEIVDSFRPEGHKLYSKE